MEVKVYDTYLLHDTAQAMVAERIAEAERRRASYRAHIRNRAEARLHRAVAIARRDGLGEDIVARELSGPFSEPTQN